MRKIGFLGILAVLGLAAGCSTAPQATPPELTTLMERAAIEELFIDYYAQFRPDSAHDFMSFFTADGRLDVNGMVANGIEEIRAMYAGIQGGGEEKPKAADAVPEGVSEMMLTNMKIDVEGDKAVATFLWHSIKAELVTTEGKIVEYGRERSELVKQDGKWLIKNRVVLTEGGMPEALLQYYPKK
ncbi:MAG: nuclear transport factor 2 family protein [Acidobacteriota bacterium]|jgi:ketosteroid isomerase-like protein|nr:nuclear transport factor 2 family protein [Acidobacteriota bacterium]NLT33144.1 nuclear transport factor 2 family protein [Acidobacteriota bacterium]